MPNTVLQRLVDEREQINRDIDSVNETIADEERDPNATDRALLARYRTRLEELEPLVVEQLELEEHRGSARDASAVLQRAGGRSSASSTTGRPAELVTPDAVYRDFGTYARDVLITRYDQIAGRVGGGERDAARARLERAVAHTLTSDVPGLVPAQHLAQILQVINKSRPLVQASRRLSLTSGKVTYPFITSRPTVSKQTAEKTETTSTKMSVSMAEQTADTFLGAGNLSWQAINWSTPDALSLWFDLAAEAYAMATEVEAGSAFTGLTVPGGPVVVAANTSEAWTAAIAAAAGVVWTNSKRSANGVATDPATFYEIAPLASNVRTVFMSEGAVNLANQSGTIAGMTLFASPGLPADTVIVGDFSALITAETPSAPVELRAVEPAIGGMEVGVIGAFFSGLVESGAFCAVTPPAGGVTTARASSSSKS
jgi:HK97 family phage major capsid protein